VFRAAHDRLVADHGERPGVIEYLHVLKLATEETVEKVEPVLRAQLAPVARKIIELAGLTPSLHAYDTLLEGEVAHAG
jgi:translation initiation factor IF-3